MRVGTSGGLADLQRLGRAGIGEEGTAGFLVEKYRKKRGTDPPEQGESLEKIQRKWHRHVVLAQGEVSCRPIAMPLPFPITDPVPTGSIVPDRAPGVVHLLTLSGHSCSPSLRKEEQNIPRQRLT